MGAKWFSLLALLLLASCSRKDVTYLKNTARNLQAQGKEQSLRIDTVFQAQREGRSTDVQNRAIGEMRNADNDGLRLTLARIFFRAFEFQKWTGIGMDTSEYKNELYRKALYLFLPAISGSIPHDRPDAVSSDYLLTPRILTNNWRFLGVLTVAMDEVDTMQTRISSGVEPESVNSLIEKGLKSQYYLKRPLYAGLVLEWKPECIYLLQMRHNYLRAMAVERLTGQDFGYASQFELLYSTPKLRNDVDVRLLSDVKDYMWKAQQTRLFLNSIGIAVVDNPVIAKAYASVVSQLPADFF